MSHTRKAPPPKHRRSKASVLLRLGTALWLIVWLVYTPLHLHLESHSHEVFAHLPASQTPSLASVSDASPTSDGDEHEHPAYQHQLKLAQSNRLASVPVVSLMAVVWMELEKGCPRSPIFGFSGLSPPELTHSWQFLLRAALPVRAPSFAS